jgi:hypothetical protein
MNERLYSPRNSENAHELVDQLSKPPERPLTPEEAERIVRFDDQVFKIDKDLVGEDADLPVELFEQEDITAITQKMMAHVHYVYPDFYLTPDGKEVAKKYELANLVSAESLEEVKEALKAFNGTKFKNAIADESQAFPEAVLVKALLDGGEPVPFDKVPIVKDPEVLPRKMHLLFAYKDYLRRVKENVKAEGMSTDEKDAKLNQIKKYQAYINDYLVDSYVDTISFMQSMEGGEVSEEVIRTLQEYGSRARKIYNYISSRGFMDAAIRFDAIKNGRHYSEESGFTPITPELTGAIQRTQELSASEVDSAFTAAEVEKLSEIKLGPQEMQDLISAALTEWGLISSSPPEEYDENRTGRADDGLWQVPIKGRKSLAVNGTKGTVSVPTNYKRAITQEDSPFGAVAVAGHEIKHVIQSEARLRSDGLHFGKEIRGRGYESVNEAGAVYEERKVQSRLFGRPRPVSQTYLRAIEALIYDRRPIAVARGFFDALRQAAPEGNLEEQAKLAANRSLRLLKGGGFSSGSLVYVELSVTMEALADLPDAQQNYIYTQAAMNLRDFVSLYQYGLTPTPSEINFGRSYEEIAEEWLRQKYLKT